MKSLNDKQFRLCESPLTTQEVRQTISNLKKDKSPGSDGLTPEFYQVFWNQIEPLYMRMIGETFCKGILPDSMRKSIITLIFKKGNKALLNKRGVPVNGHCVS